MLLTESGAQPYTLLALLLLALPLLLQMAKLAVLAAVTENALIYSLF
jgi:hypothetical protein